MDLRLKSCTSNTSTCTLVDRSVENNTTEVDVDVDVDRVSSLPIELLLGLLSFLPTKDAAAMCVLSRRMCRLFPLITTLDFDATHICHCSKHPSEIQQFPSFVTFVNTVLGSHQSQYLTKFRLGLGVDFRTRHSWGCNVNCFPDLKSSQINAWISFPLTRSGLTELDIRILIKEPTGGDAQLPPEIFTCETLEVLKLDVNLGFNLISTFHLPKLKLCHIYASLYSEDDFLTRLVSSCPLLEDFAVEAYWNHAYCARFTSPSLRRLHLKFYYPDLLDDTDGLLINAPNLEYLFYHDNLAFQYSVQNMPALVNAVVGIRNMPFYEPSVAFNQQIFNLIRPLSNVQHLSLLGKCTKALHFADVKDQLPLFPNLKCLELGFNAFSFWNKVVLAFLNCSPVLETLIFPEGLALVCTTPITNKRINMSLKLEQEFFRRAQAIVPQCCRVHLKRIVIKRYFGLEREVDLIQFLLRQAYVLEELVIFRCVNTRYPIPDPVSTESTLKMLPRSSETCSIQVN